VIAAANARLASLDEPSGGATATRMLDTLRATSTDEEAASLLAAGRLTEDLTWAGLGLDGFEVPASPAGRPRQTPRRPAPSAEPSSLANAAATRQAERDKARWTKLDEAARAAEAQAQALTREADDANRAATRAEGVAAKAQRTAEQAQARATRARAKADDASPS
jgi:hypothetical protein